jgi:uncharacterized membrane protein YeaQ/YmgE (transglycosylase-associated protein family)
MALISTILIGFIVGLFARAIMPGRDITGFIMTTLLGICGALVGKFIGQGLGLYDVEQSAGFFMSLIGAVLLLFLYNQFRKKNPG